MYGPCGMSEDERSAGQLRHFGRPAPNAGPSAEPPWNCVREASGVVCAAPSASGSACGQLPASINLIYGYVMVVTLDFCSANV